MDSIIYKYRRLLTEGYNFTNVDEVMSALEANQIGVKIQPAVNYKYVNNYLIKARKALKEGRIEEADKLAWRACSLMHEDEMQGPGVSADKNAYNIFHKQLGNIQNAIIAARKANKESN